MQVLTLAGSFASGAAVNEASLQAIANLGTRTAFPRADQELKEAPGARKAPASLGLSHTRSDN